MGIAPLDILTWLKNNPRVLLDLKAPQKTIQYFKPALKLIDKRMDGNDIEVDNWTIDNVEQTHAHWAARLNKSCRY